LIWFGDLNLHYALPFWSAKPVILDYLASKTISSNDLVVVSPDVGGVARARAFAKKLSDAPLAIVDKRRHGHNVAEASTSILI
jgi:ribose-phosphate pyrophosphokinase